jgi:hypothetical protein
VTVKKTTEIERAADAPEMAVVPVFVSALFETVE